MLNVILMHVEEIRIILIYNIAMLERIFSDILESVLLPCSHFLVDFDWPCDHRNSFQTKTMPLCTQCVKPLPNQ